MASQLELFLPANYTTHLLSSIYGATVAVLEVWSIFPFAIKYIFPCSFGNKCMCLLTHVYGNQIALKLVDTASRAKVSWIDQ